MTDELGSDWLDPEEFPFTEAELREALVPWTRFPGCETLADDIATGLREGRADRERAQAAIDRGSRKMEEVNYSIYVFPDEVFALVADLSPDHEARVEAWRRAVRAKHRANRLTQATYRARLDPRSEPPPAVIAQIDAEDAEEEARWSALRAEVQLGIARFRSEASPEGGA